LTRNRDCLAQGVSSVGCTSAPVCALHLSKWWNRNYRGACPHLMTRAPLNRWRVPVTGWFR
jgi:hypothetical protein